MKMIKYLLISSVLLTFSCSKDDPKPASSASLSLASNQQTFTAPTKMQSSSDPQAQMAVSWIATANAMSSYLSYFNAPAGATKSDVAITASNARTSSGSVTVYIWTDSGTGYKIAYQVTENSNSYYFDAFLMLPNSTQWLKYVHAEELKDKSKGSMKIYDIFTGGNPSTVWLTYAWTRSGDNFTLTITDLEDLFKVELAINQKTKAGNVKYYLDNVLEYQMTWDATGAGTWIEYDEQGNIVEQGTWTV